jgi:hypothetical protein
MTKFNWDRHNRYYGKVMVDPEHEGIVAARWVRDAMKAKRAAQKAQEDAALEKRLREKIARYKANRSRQSCAEEAGRICGPRKPAGK